MAGRNRVAQFLTLYLLLATSAPTAMAAPIENPERLLVGVYVNGRETQNIDALRSSGEFWISLEDFAEIAGVTLAKRDKTAEFGTPLGKAEIAWDELGQFEGINFISRSLLLKVFNIESAFSALDYALFFDVPWRPGAARASEGKAVPEPEITPSGGALSFLRSYGEYGEEANLTSKRWYADLDVGGRLFGGTWLLGARGRNNYSPRLERYFWNRIYGRSVFRIGANQISVNPLLSSINYDGAQFAFDNAGIEKYTDYASSFGQDSMLSESLPTQVNIVRDDGPPAGIAELRINDRPVAYVRVGLNGHYEFRNIERLQGVFQNVKVLLYRRTINEPPVATLDFTMTMTGQMLSAGELLFRAGGGREKLYYNDPASPQKGSAGFAMARYGLSDWLTLAAAQQEAGARGGESLAGVRMSLGRHFAFSLDAAARDNTNGYYSELRGVGEGWEISLRDVYYGQKFYLNPERPDYDHYLRSFFNVLPYASIGLFARQSRQTSRPADIVYAKPGFSFSPTRSLLLSAMPNMDGDYRIFGHYLHGPYAHATIMYESHLYNATLFLETLGRTSYYLGYDYRDETNKGSVYANIFLLNRDGGGASLQGGASYNHKYPGFFMSLRWIITPGIEIGGDYRNGYRQLSDEKRDQSLQLSLRADFAATGRGLSPVNNSMINFSRGGISGSIYDEEGRKVASEAGIIINGINVAQTVAGGSFYAGDIKPGVYLVEIDEEKLPIEYTPEKRSFLVEVAASAVTRVDFIVKVRYGLAGKISAAQGEPVAEARVIAIDANGETAGSGRSSQFGYYRIDNLATGEYTLNVTHVEGRLLPEPRPSIKIRIERDYIFGQDIVIPQEAGEAGKGE
jgi:hypothetical protein